MIDKFGECNDTCHEIESAGAQILDLKSRQMSVLDIKSSNRTRQMSVLYIKLSDRTS